MFFLKRIVQQVLRKDRLDTKVRALGISKDQYTKMKERAKLLTDKHPRQEYLDCLDMQIKYWTKFGDLD